MRASSKSLAFKQKVVAFCFAIEKPSFRATANHFKSLTPKMVRRAQLIQDASRKRTAKHIFFKIRKPKHEDSEVKLHEWYKLQSFGLFESTTLIDDANEGRSDEGGSEDGDRSEDGDDEEKKEQDENEDEDGSVTNKNDEDELEKTVLLSEKDCVTTKTNGQERKKNARLASTRSTYSFQDTRKKSKYFLRR